MEISEAEDGENPNQSAITLITMGFKLFRSKTETLGEKKIFLIINRVLFLKNTSISSS